MLARHAVLLLAIAGFALPNCVVRGDDIPTKPAMHSIRAADGLNIVCQERGKHHDTAIIFLHGWCGDSGYWTYQEMAFARNYRVITLDQAGHGDSGKNRKEWTVSSLAGDVESVVKALGLKRVILVGHSMGGSVALLAAKRMPGIVIGVVGVDTLPNAERVMPEETKKHFVDGFATDFKASLRNAVPSMLPDNVDPELRKWLLTRAEAQDPTMAIGLIRDLVSQDTKTLMKEAKVPVRCINSSGGFKFHTPTAIDVNKKYCDYDAVMMDGVGHYPMLEKPGEFNKKLSQVLQALSSKK